MEGNLLLIATAVAVALFVSAVLRSILSMLESFLSLLRFVTLLIALCSLYVMGTDPDIRADIWRGLLFILDEVLSG